MARKRSIDSSFWTCEKVAPALNWRARLLLLGLISAADDCGRLHAEPTLIKAAVFPFDRVQLRTIAKDLEILEARKLIYLYSVNGRTYLQLHGWHHQKLDHPSPSRIPPYPDSELLASISRKHRERVATDSLPSEVKRSEEKENSRKPQRKEGSKPWD